MAKPPAPSPDAPKPSAPTRAPRKQRPHGRSVADFPGRTPAEKELLRCARLGVPAMISSERPEQKPENFIRAGLIRFLALGGDDQNPVHEHGVMLQGAWIEGVIDLDASRCPHPLVLVRCRIEQVTANYATLRTLRLSGCHLADGLSAEYARMDGTLMLDEELESDGSVLLGGARIEGDLSASGARLAPPHGDALNCDDASIAGNVFLIDGFHATGRVRLLGVKISGELSCRQGRFEAAATEALSFDRAVIDGSVFLHNGFNAEGDVRLLGARIGGNLDCSGGRMNNPRGFALACDSASITRSVYLNDGCETHGEVRLFGVTIGRHLDCRGGRFANPVGPALQLDNMEVTGTFFFREAEVSGGGVDLSGAKVANLVDDLASWNGTSGSLILQEFTYSRFAGPSPVDAASRIAWLELQRPEFLDERRFAPQPWEQLAAVLRATGHAEAARQVAVAKHRRLRDAGRPVGGSRAWDWLYGALVGYGYRPRRLLSTIAVVWFLCFLVYWAAANPRWFGSDDYLLMPTRPQPDAACLAARAAAHDPRPCPPKAPRHEDLFLPAYSAEVLIPVVSLGAKGEWKPVVRSPEGERLYWGWAVRVVYWFEILFGWLASLLLVAAVGNLIKKD